MNWTNRMARHGSERSLHTLHSMHPVRTSIIHNNNNNNNNNNDSTTMNHSRNIVSPSKAICSSPEIDALLDGSIDGVSILSSTMNSSSNTTIVPGSSPLALDSRIPRPSSNNVLRRSSSMRIRGERLPAHHSRPTTTTTTSALLGQHHQHHYRRHNHLLLQQQQQQQQHPDHRIFPVITENGTDSPRQRSLSLSLTPARPRTGHAASGTTPGADDSDAESVRSYGSACSTASACDHASFALNGTTWSGRSRKYVVHCSNHTGDNEQYLTPTQRAARQIRKFQALLKEARIEIEEKNREIVRLTKEVVELRLYKASLNSPDERTDSSDALTVRENNPFSPESPCKDLLEEGSFEKVASPETPDKRAQSDVPSSLADSGHFEDGSVHSKDSVCLPETVPELSGNNPPSNLSQDEPKDASRSVSVVDSSPERDEERRRLVDHYESRIEEMHRRHIDEMQELKQKHNDKVESLLNQLSEVNTRYCEVRPSVDAAEARTRELEVELEAVKNELDKKKALIKEQEEKDKQMYLKVHANEQETARTEKTDQIPENAQQKSSSKVNVTDLQQELTVTKAELDKIKDTSYSPEPHISADRSQNLLSAQEAVSLWVLGTRKFTLQYIALRSGHTVHLEETASYNSIDAMYRSIVESKYKKDELDLVITLQFLKSAFYYFLTDKENHRGHLNAIESILGFTEAEKHNIDKIYGSVRK
uniref:protein quick-to-court isoform X1 n=1 Tax=Vespula vulgaris TaxID=7454 RepID=UPI00212F4080|nr:protein quick-to-court isoform X1 [Vespula vulgaris]XP_050863598.1 protein quick-to-court isoform X1 [Vespula vulgaris]XP_050863599.1 protein quick-to-court isoform X1 [Vespula vulgaris]XP_050863600.1 protein quick-to-court isoform X1 [Vespula vulgaris]